MTAGASRVELRSQRRDRGGRWDAVERHVNHRRDAAGGGRSCGRVESFPLRAARLVDMDVGVDNAWRNEKIAGVDDDVSGASGRHIVEGADGHDSSVLDLNGGWAL